MKKIILLVIALVVFNISKAQESIIKVNPIGFAFGIFNATYEKAVSENNSFTIGASYFNWSNANASGIGGEAAYRFYFSNNNDAPEGIYAAPFLGVHTISIGDSSGFGFGGGAQAGYQWIFDSGLALDLFFGYGYYAGGVDGSTTGVGGLPKLGVAVGYAF